MYILVPRTISSFKCCTLQHWKAGRNLETRLMCACCTLVLLLTPLWLKNGWSGQNPANYVVYIWCCMHHAVGYGGCVNLSVLPGQPAKGAWQRAEQTVWGHPRAATPHGMTTLPQYFHPIIMLITGIYSSECWKASTLQPAKVAWTLLSLTT